MTAVVFALGFEADGFRCRGADVWVLGRGGVAAVECFERRLAAQRPETVVLAGLAGGLDPSLRVGDVLVVATGGGAEESAFFPGVRRVRGVHCDAVVARASEKKSLYEAGLGAVCDMETQLLGKVCERERVGFCSLRAVSDDAQSDLPVPPEVLMTPQTGGASVGGILWSLGRRPWRVPAFVRMVRNAGFARRCLHGALREGLEPLPRMPAKVHNRL